MNIEFLEIGSTEGEETAAQNAHRLFALEIPDTGVLVARGPAEALTFVPDAHVKESTRKNAETGVSEVIARALVSGAPSEDGPEQSEQEQSEPAPEAQQPPE